MDVKMRLVKEYKKNHLNQNVYSPIVDKSNE